MTKVAFVCVQNAGRSQMATAFAEREVREAREAREARERREASERASEQRAGRKASGEAVSDDPRASEREASERASEQRAGRKTSGEAVSDDPRASEREASERASEQRAGRVEIVTGGTDPADHVHEEVVEVMAERDIDISGRTPREVTHEELQDCEYVITMGCSAKDVCPATWSGENRDWGLNDPDGQGLDEVRAIRDEIEERVADLFDEIAD